MMKLVLAVLSCIAIVNAHICSIYPSQRGGYNIDSPGEDACYRPTAPCGGITPGNPTLNLQGGTTFTVLLQQNLNHYNPGWPGWIDVALGNGTSQTSDAEFTVLAVVPDYWAHLQASQTNFSIPIVVPNFDCAKCTLRVRYHPNKPTEPIFHNCADVTIQANSAIPSSQKWGTVLALADYNVLSSFSFRASEVVQINWDGSLTTYDDADQFVLRNAKNRKAKRDLPQYSFADGLLYVSPQDTTIVFIGAESSQFENFTGSHAQIPKTAYGFDYSAGAILGTLDTPLDQGQWCGVLWADDISAPLYVQQVPGKAPYTFRYQLRNGQDNYEFPLLGITPDDDTFVNYFWSSYDSNKKQFYILTGDENSLYSLRVVLHTINIPTNQTNTVKVDNSKYTVSVVYADSDSGNLYALSPGLFPAPHDWYLITINPSNGAVTPVSRLTFNQEFTGFYGGNVYNGLQNGKIAHVFYRVIDNSPVLGVIDLTTGKLEYTTSVDAGVNNAVRFHNFVWTPPANN